MCIHLADKLTQHEFIAHLQQIVNRFLNKTIFLFLDNYPSHTTPSVYRFFKSHPQLKIIWMPKYSPKLNVIEGIWKELKNVVGNWFYSTIPKMERAIMKFFRTLWNNKQKVISLTAFNKKYSI